MTVKFCDKTQSIVSTEVSFADTVREIASTQVSNMRLVVRLHEKGGKHYASASVFHIDLNSKPRNKAIMSVETEGL